MLIAIEGIDGSGKATQAALLAAALRNRGAAVERFDFPQYESSFFGLEIGRYLEGEYGDLETIPAKFAALLFALDRFEARERLSAALEGREFVICDRYVPSNMCHQSARFVGETARKMRNWVAQVEYGILHMPRPDIVVLLDSEVSVAQELVLLKAQRTYTDKAHDLHEESWLHLDAALAEFRKMAKEDSWITVNTISANGDIRSPSEIHDELLSGLDELLSSGDESPESPTEDVVFAHSRHGGEVNK